MGGVTLTDEQIGRCKEICVKGATRTYPKKKDYEKMFPINPPAEEASVEQEYFVEYPPEEQEGQTQGQYRLKEEEELKLVSTVNKALTLKRGRSIYKAETNEEAEEGRNKKQGMNLLKTLTWVEDSTVKMNVDELMAEEAGLTTPPPPNESTLLELSGCGCGPNNA